ncbi:MAG: SET domain-containing protein-lysine N-methyltransferase [Hyphomicrobiaceae bacterium]
MPMLNNRTLIYGLFPRSANMLHPTPASPSKPRDGAGSAISWGVSGVSGRGLFSTCTILTGEPIICSPAMAVKAAALDASVSPYAFVLNRELSADCDDMAAEYALVFGPVSLANHADAPNAAVSFVKTTERGLEAQLTALRTIPKGSEIFICYPDRHRYVKPGWF